MTTLVLVPTERERALLLADRKTRPLACKLPSCSHAGLTWSVCGVGPAAASLATAYLIAQFRPQKIVLAGIGGAFRPSGYQPGTLVQAQSDCFADLGYRSDNRFVTLDEMGIPLLADQVSATCFPAHNLTGDLPQAPFLTVSAITNSESRANALWQRFGAAIENMEGAAVALACQFHGVAFAQIRGVSNWVGPRNPATWQVKEPLARLGQWLETHLPR